jgi:hypothetical protein
MQFCEIIKAIVTPLVLTLVRSSEQDVMGPPPSILPEIANHSTAAVVGSVPLTNSRVPIDV